MASENGTPNPGFHRDPSIVSQKTNAKSRENSDIQPAPDEPTTEIQTSELDGIPSSKQEPTNIQIGKRNATLFLSSHSLKTTKPDDISRTLRTDSLSSHTSPRIPIAEYGRSPSSLAKKDSKPASRTQSRISPRVASSLSQSSTVQLPPIKQPTILKEFTFTGYDIMNDGTYMYID